MLDGILVRLRVHTTVCERAKDFDRVKQRSKAERSGRDSAVHFHSTEPCYTLPSKNGSHHTPGRV